MLDRGDEVTPFTRGRTPHGFLRPGATYLDAAVAPFGSYRVMVAQLRARKPIIVHGDGTGLWGHLPS